MKFIRWVLEDFGFNDSMDYLDSTFHIASIKPILGISLILGSIASFCESFMGLSLSAYISFCVLLLIEFVTGVLASIREKQKIQSKKFGRFLLKIITYSLMIGIVNVFNINFKASKVGFIYDIIYWSMINLITIQLVISVFENMSRLGYQEANRVFKLINKILKKYLDLKD